MSRQPLDHPNDIDLFTAGLAEIETSLEDDVLRITKQAEPSSAPCNNEDRRRLGDLRRQELDHVGAYNFAIEVVPFNRRLVTVICAVSIEDNIYQIGSMGVNDCNDGINKLMVTIDGSCSTSFELQETNTDIMYNAAITKPLTCAALNLKDKSELNIQMEYYGLQDGTIVDDEYILYGSYQENIEFCGGLSGWQLNIDRNNDLIDYQGHIMSDTNNEINDNSNKNGRYTVIISFIAIAIMAILYLLTSHRKKQKMLKQKHKMYELVSGMTDGEESDDELMDGI